ncbi:hypothetical protein [Paenibacillus ginsengihumi]|uniref:hypothetical protein n=1 Tax=Paenibacillus ginsengihumi TaxID=431596 RepID=UPI000592E41A|nr:hypothetical protein [Paenibacillus ginsengihumi]
MLKKVMVRAHELAKTFVGNYSARMSLALRQAWAEAKAPKAPRYVTVDLHSNKRSKTWVAAIIGTHPVYKLDRKFVNPVRYGSTEWELKAGIYEVCEAGKRYFIRVANGDYQRIDADDVMEMVA